MKAVIGTREKTGMSWYRNHDEMIRMSGKLLSDRAGHVDFTVREDALPKQRHECIYGSVSHNPCYRHPEA